MLQTVRHRNAVKRVKILSARLRVRAVFETAQAVDDMMPPLESAGDHNFAELHFPDGESMLKVEECCISEIGVSRWR